MNDLETIGDFYIFPNEIIKLILYYFSFYELLDFQSCSKYWKIFISKYSFIKEWYKFNGLGISNCSEIEHIENVGKFIAPIYFKIFQFNIFEENIQYKLRVKFSWDELDSFEKLSGQRIPIYYKKRKWFFENSYLSKEKNEIKQHFLLKIISKNDFGAKFLINNIEFQTCKKAARELLKLSGTNSSNITNVWKNYYVLTNNENVLKWYPILRIIPQFYQKCCK